MPKPLSDKLAQLPENRRKKITKRANELISQEMSLREVRKALELTQEYMAQHLHIRQEGVSRLEKRSDLLITTLRSYIETMGGSLELVVKFPNRAAIILQGLGEIKSRNTTTRIDKK